MTIHIIYDTKDALDRHARTNCRLSLVVECTLAKAPEIGTVGLVCFTH